MTSTSPPGSAPIYNGRYELSHQIARGGTAQVYLARDLLLDRPVALKVLFPELSTDSSFVERFRREAQAAANLSHPNIVPVFDWGESERTYFIVMEFVDGEPLSSIIRSQAPLPPLRAAAIGADIAKALSYAHRHGVVHRDVKPGNVLLTRDGQVKVTDFGIARAVGADDNVTQTGLVMGTATYFSPEQAQGLGVDGRSDVYSLGVVLYEMVTSKAPFSADTPVAIAYKHVSEAPVPPRDIEPRIPEQLEAVIMRAMAKQPSDRYATAEDLQADLQRFGQGQPVLAAAAYVGAATGAMAAPTQAFGAAPTGVMGRSGGSATALLERTGDTAGVPVGDRPEMPKRRWIPWVVAGILLAALLGILIYVGGQQLGWFGGAASVRVPDVVGHNLSYAEGVLRGQGLNYDSHPQFSGRPKNQVLSTTPGRDTIVKQGASVAIYYSAGLKPVDVPGVVGDTISTAEARLKAAGLNYNAVPVTRTDLTQQAGIVKSTFPEANTSVQPGKTILVKYWATALTVKVPNLAGLTVSAAQGVLDNHGLQLGNTTNVVSSAKAGTIVSSQPASGTPEPQGTNINVFVSGGPGVALPNLVGQRAGRASAEITSLGLVPVTQYQTGSAAQKDTVISQNPGPGQYLSGTTVTIIVDSGPPPTTTTPTTSPPTTKPSGTSGPTGNTGTGKHHH